MAQSRKAGKRVKIGKAGTWALVFSVFFVQLLFYTWCRVQCVQVGIAIGQQNRKQQELTTYQNSLKIEMARLKAPERISHIARNQLGLNIAEPQQVITVP